MAIENARVLAIDRPSEFPPNNDCIVTGQGDKSVPLPLVDGKLQPGGKTALHSTKLEMYFLYRLSRQ